MSGGIVFENGRFDGPKWTAGVSNALFVSDLTSLAGIAPAQHRVVVGRVRQAAGPETLTSA